MIANVIRYYQYDHFTKSGAGTDTVEISAVTEAPVSSKHGTPTKTSIALFRSSYAHIFDLLEIDSTDDADVPASPLHAFGIAALDWLIAGSPWIVMQKF